MQSEKVILKFRKKKPQIFLLSGIVIFFCLTVAAQSGRHPKKNIDFPKPPDAGRPAAIDPALPLIKPDEKITSLTVFGANYQKNSILYYSNAINIALKEMVRSLKGDTDQPGLNVTRGEKIDFDEAEKRAKKETKTYILWIGLQIADDAFGNSSVDYIDYAILAPQTAKHLTQGRVQPGNTDFIGPGGILSIPSVRKHTKTSTPQIIRGTQEITARLVHQGWLK